MPTFTIHRLVPSGLVAFVIALSLLGCQTAPPAPAATQAPAASQPKPTTVAALAAPSQVPAGPAAAPTAAPQVLKVGIMTDLTGLMVRNGIAKERFIRMGIDDVNAKGGVKVGGKIYRLEAVTADTRSVSDGGIPAANRLVLDEKVKFVLGGTSGPTAAAQPVTEANKVLVLGFTGLDTALGSNHPLYFLMASHIMMRTAAIYDYVVQERPDIKRVALIAPDDPSGRSGMDFGEAKAKEKGLTVIAKEMYPLDTKDFAPMAVRILRQNPDAIDIGGAGGRGTLTIGLTKALSEQGFKGPVFAYSADLGPLKEGASWMEGFTVSQLIDYVSPSVTTGERDVFQRYIRKYSEDEVEPIVVVNYNDASVLAQAMEKAGTVDDTAKIAEALRAGEWETMWSKEFGKSRFIGTKTFGTSVLPEQPIYLSKIQGGKLVTFKAIKATMP